MTDPDLVSIFSTSRRELLDNSFYLTSLIKGTQSNKSPLVRNKGRIYQLGLLCMEKNLKRHPSMEKEVINLYRLSDYYYPSEIKDPSIFITSTWMDYSNIYEEFSRDDKKWMITFVDFANRYLGGGWLGHGNVQEEQMIQRSPEMALLLGMFNGDRSDPQLLVRGRTYSDPYHPDPLLITNLRFYLHQSDEKAKSDAIHRPNYRIGNYFECIDSPPGVNVLAIAAPQLQPSERNAVYDEDLIMDLLNTAINGFALIKMYDQSKKKRSQLFTGLWGAGAFGHNSLMSIMVQIIAARLTEIDRLIIQGIDESLEAQIEERSAEIYEMESLDLDDYVQYLMSLDLKTKP